MSASGPTLILPTTSGKWNVTGEKFRGDGWYGFQDGFHTISVHYVNLRGRFYIEATLADDPDESDWFAISLGKDTPYVEYPKGNPTGEHGGDTGSEAFVFKANVAWVRARLDRSYIGDDPGPEQVPLYGLITKVLMNR